MFCTIGEMSGEGYLRIGELSRRVGVSPELLRAWERRYDLLGPDRSPGGFRLYSDADVERIGVMKEHLGRGLSAAEAARLARVEAPTPVRAVVENRAELAADREALRDALDRFDEVGAHDALDRLLSTFTAETVLGDVVMPLLRELGDRWEQGQATIAQEHFASNLLRGRLHGMARGWDRGTGPRAILACPPDDLHDLGLLVFGLALRARGWRITFLGANTPLETIADTASRISPDVIVIAALMPSRIRSVLGQVRELAKDRRVALAGAAATPKLAEQAGAELLAEDPLHAAERLAGLSPAGASN
jgi:DNA-binding transcriptional MerR regulator/methylmalonyl-CoA mutase cobalamin-binding subunit